MNKSFTFTEDQDMSGADYPKPFYTVPCPQFTEKRLDVFGVAVKAGILKARGYPELIARRILSGIMVAHEHDKSSYIINAIRAGSQEYTYIPPTAAGVAAPLLRAVELQVELYRTARRLSRSTPLEAIFPLWAYGYIRADLALRTGQSQFDVSDEQINSWFRLRGVAPQFVYMDPIPDSAVSAYPEFVSFLLYEAGTWVLGTQSVITVETLYDSALLGTNDYMALFTEEGILVAKRGLDSRKIHVRVCANGSTGAGELLKCDGSPDAA